MQLLRAKFRKICQGTEKIKDAVVYGGGGGGGLALGRILFVLPKMWSKLELSLMRLLRAKFGKNLSVDQKDQRRRSVWVGHADFSKIAQRKQKFIKHVNCMFTQEN